MTKVSRYDKGEIRNASFTQEGFLKVDAICTRTGVFTYLNKDGSLRRELRHPDDVLRKNSLASMKMIPITLLHPKEKIVDSNNSQMLSKGMTGESVEVDGKFIKNRLLIMNQDAIDAVLNGMQELSLGYSVSLIEEDGEYDGERYDYRQTEIEYNHLAIVPSARAGKEARIILDGDDAEQSIEVENVRLDGLIPPKTKTKKQDNQSSPEEKRRKRMDKIKLDGIDYEAAPEVINALNKATARADELEGKVNSITKEKSELQAKHDTLDEKLKKAEKIDHASKIQEGIKERLALVSEATPHLDEETVKKVADMSDEEIKKAVIVAKFPEAKLDGKDENYIQARYDSAIELKVENDNSMAGQRKQINGDSSNGEKKINVDESKKNFHASLTSAWQESDK